MLIWPGSVSQLEVCTSKVRRGNVSPLEIDTIRYDDKLSMFQLSRSNSQRITSKAGWYLLSIISSPPSPLESKKGIQAMSRLAAADWCHWLDSSQ